MSVISLEVIQQCISSLRQTKQEQNNEINFPQLRVLISSLRQIQKGIVLSSDSFTEILTLLLDVLVSGVLRPDSEVLLSTTLCLLAKRTLPVDECCSFLSECIAAERILTVNLNYQSKLFYHSVIIKKVDLYRLCMCCSILECFDVNSFHKFYVPLNFSVEYAPKDSFLLVFEILESSCNKFSIFTTLSFKSMMIWLRRLDELYCLKLVDPSLIMYYLRRVIFIVNCNWENQIAVVRNRNLEIVKFLVSMLPISVQPENDVLNVFYNLEMSLQHLSWRMKRKYFILTTMLPKFGIKKALGTFPNIPEGLVLSLSYPHLVSAGTNLYREILKGIQLDDWQRYFLGPVKEMLFGSSRLAKENFMSYWMPESLEAYSLVMDVLLTDSMSNGNSSLLQPLLSLLKIGRRNNILKWEEIDRELISQCLHHLDEGTRSEAFSVVCESTKTTVPPSAEEFEMVCTFLEDNVNTDSARARQLMIKSFRTFLSRIRDSFLNSLKNEENLIHEDRFMLWLSKFIIDNSNPGSNYQRKISSLYLLRIIFESSTEKMKLKRHKINLSGKYFEEQINVSFKHGDIFSLLLRSILYPAEDVRDIACSILKMNFEPPNDERLEFIWKSALHKCASPMFYEVECAAILAELFAHWTLNHTSLVSGESFDFFDALLLHAEKQLMETEDNLLRSAMEGPIHGTLGILHRMISNSNILAKVEMKEAQVKRILHLIDCLVAYLIGVLSSKTTSASNIAPSFEEMGEAIRLLILRNAEDFTEADDKKLSDASELLLNCIWLNLKMSCLLASGLAMAFGAMNAESLKEEDVERCAQLIAFVLLNCRHKGVIESAGGALFSLASFCSKNSSQKLRGLPVKLVQQCLEVTLGKGTSVGGTSITRRSAGLSILLHKLVAADAENTIHICITKLLSEANRSGETSENNTETEDLPQTRALHFLKVIVEDSTLFHSTSPYMSDIAIVCITSFSSSIWGIRNAALQLFGPVVSKLVSQNGIEEDGPVDGCVTVEELNAHYPELVDYILKELNKAINWREANLEIVSPTLIPILSLCSRFSIGMPHLHSDSFKKIMLEFQTIFFKLLSTPIIAVRKLSAKAVSAFTSLMQLPAQILFLIDSLTKVESENELHGKLLSIKMLSEKLALDSHLIPALSTKSEEIKNGIKEIKLTNLDKQTFFFIEALLYELQGFSSEEMDNLYANRKKMWFPGMMLQSVLSSNTVMLSCPEKSICDVLKKCSKYNYAMFESSIVSLKKRIELNNLSKTTEAEIMELLIELCDLSLPPNLLALCLQSINQLSASSPSITISVDKLESIFSPLIMSSKYGTACSAAALPFLACFAMRNHELRLASNVLVDVAMTMKERSSPKHWEELRLEASKALIHFLPVFDEGRGNLEEDTEIKASVLHSAVSLLQDENTDVRAEAARFASSLQYSKDLSSRQMNYSPQYCIKLIFSHISKLIPLKDAVQFLWKKLTNEYTLDELISQRRANEIRNPFSHGVSNVYAESVIITKMARKTFLILIETDMEDLQAFKNILDKDKKRIIEEAAAMSEFISHHNLDEFHTKTEVYLALIKIKFQVEALVKLGVSKELLDVFLELEKASADIVA